MRVLAIVVVLFTLPVPVAAQDLEDLARWQRKADRVAAVENLTQGAPASMNLIPPSGSTATRSYFGVEVHQGGLYEPSIFPDETWLEIACIHNDLRVPYDRTRHGFGLLTVHAIVYDADLNSILNTNDTTESDEAICDVASTVDTSFIELSRSLGSRAAAVAFIIVPRTGQYIEAAKVIYRILPR